MLLTGPIYAPVTKVTNFLDSPLEMQDVQAWEFSVDSKKKSSVGDLVV